MAGDHRILLVEDEVLLRMDMAIELRAAGFLVVEAGNANEGLTLLVAKAIDLVVTDLNMPGELKGDAWIAELRQVYPSLPIVVVSASQPSERDRADAFFVKPVLSAALIRKCAELLSNRLRPAENVENG